MADVLIVDDSRVMREMVIASMRRQCSETDPRRWLLGCVSQSVPPRSWSPANGSGPGVAAEIKQRIWEPFFTTRQRGTGLGLAIVRKRMEEAGGSARLAATRSGEGARFELRVPVAGS